ncbi:hypothetical protein [Dyella sp. ASV21]|uniref:hypothetical protein n=1 Tax=Dyella sp. ASV21 TaxID=2795114 RepID=UPI0018EC0F60|nr:hypothetical protein [Dyella sp. ASV21]
MNSFWSTFSDKDREAFRCAITFLEGRMMQQGTLNWAMDGLHSDRVKRSAIEWLIEHAEYQEPWASAWRLMQLGSQQAAGRQDASLEAHRIGRRIEQGDRSYALVKAITDLVRPVLKVERAKPFGGPKSRSKPRFVSQLLRASLDSADLQGLATFHLGLVDDVGFLNSLASSLEGAVNEGLELGRQAGWEKGSGFWKLGQLASVAYKRRADANDETDVDAYHTGIAPSVKLLHAVTQRLSQIDESQATNKVRAWYSKLDPVFVRMWASFGSDPRFASSEEVVQKIIGLSDVEFWRTDLFPEIAQLRANRFSDLTRDGRGKLLARMKRGPARALWPKSADKEVVKVTTARWATREVMRIAVAGGLDDNETAKWLKVRLEAFPEYREMAVDEDFPESKAFDVAAVPTDASFSALLGHARLHALNTALSSTPRSWRDDPAEQARSWLQQPVNILEIARAVAAEPASADKYPTLMETVGWMYRPPQGEGIDLVDAMNFLRVIVGMDDASLRLSIDGLTQWVSAWEDWLARDPLMIEAWMRLWPLAVERTNKPGASVSSIDLNAAGGAESDGDHEDLDTLNTPSGKLAGVFLRMCPSLNDRPHPFNKGSSLEVIRSLIVADTGKSGLIGRHRMIESLGYFLAADESWVKVHLVEPLLAEDGASLALWRALSRQWIPPEMIKLLGNQVPRRILDPQLGRRTRSSLLGVVVFDCLMAFGLGHQPSVKAPLIQQTLRAAEGELRGHAARIVGQYFAWSLANPEKSGYEDTMLHFRRTVGRFLDEVWPKERSLVTSGVAAGFATLPATSTEAFVEAVHSVRPFIVPFECWSLHDFGFGRTDDSSAALALIDSRDKAAALLLLLDDSIGNQDGSVVPFDLSFGLDRIVHVDPSLGSSPAFRRLSTLARRR